MRYLYTSLFHHFGELSITHTIFAVPSYGPKNDIAGKVTTFEV